MIINIKYASASPIWIIEMPTLFFCIQLSLNYKTLVISSAPQIYEYVPSATTLPPASVNVVFLPLTVFDILSPIAL